MIDEQTYNALLPLALKWAQATEQFVLARGFPLGEKHLADARRAGVQDGSKIRILVVERIAFPDDPDLAEAARRAGIFTDDTRCVGFGHAVIVRADAWGDRELLVHNFVHIAQCERSGGLDPWIHQYLGNRRDCAEFSIGTLEQEARGLAHEICNGRAVMAK